MPRFFTEEFSGDRFVLTGENARHAAKSLRMQPGEKLTLCDGNGLEAVCVIEEIGSDRVEGAVLHRAPSQSEPNLSVVLYQGVPKSDKMDLIVQKSVELGVTEIVPTVMRRCISRPDEAGAKKKTVRWQKIAREAAQQSGRGRIPTVQESMPLKKAVERAAKAGRVLVFYEGGGQSLRQLADSLTPGETVSVFIGPEGGLDESDLQVLREAGAETATLGPRILRTETAPLAALTALMLLSGNME